MTIEQETLANHTSSGSVTSTADDVLQSPQRFRVHVPTANAELVMGLDDDGVQGLSSSFSTDVYRDATLPWGIPNIQTNEHVVASGSVILGIDDLGFVGLRSTIDHGNVYIGAVGAADLGSTYQHTVRIATIVETALGLARHGLLAHSASYTGNWSTLQKTISVSKVLWATQKAITSPMSGGSGGAANFDYFKTGHVQLFGSRSVSTDSLESVSSSAALFNSMGSGVSSSVDSLLLGSVNAGVLASLNGGYSATVNGGTVGLIGARDAEVAARAGRAGVRGEEVYLGNKTIISKISGTTNPTTDVWLRANEHVEITVPQGAAPPETPADMASSGHLGGHTGAPIGLQLLRTQAHLSGGTSALRLGASAQLIASRSVVSLSRSAVELGRSKLPAQIAANLAVKTARTAYNTAMEGAVGIVNQLTRVAGRATPATALGAVAGVAATIGGLAGASGVGAGVGAAAGAKAGDKDGDTEGGAQLGAIAGSVIGTVGGVVALGLIAARVAGNAQRVAQKAAKDAYHAALHGAFEAEAAAATLDPVAPRVKISDTGIEISYGPSAFVKVSMTGVEIKGLMVKINDATYLPPTVPGVPSPSLPDPPAVPQMPDVISSSVVAAARVAIDLADPPLG
jgi:hypothetical protein